MEGISICRCPIIRVGGAGTGYIIYIALSHFHLHMYIQNQYEVTKIHSFWINLQHE